MAHSRRERHRDREPGRRQIESNEQPAPNRVFQMTDAERQEIARCLRYIDEARRTLERQMRAENREIQFRELRASADKVFEVLNELEEIDGPGPRLED